MMASEQNSPSSSSRSPRVEVDPGSKRVKVTLSLPADGQRNPNRKKVLEKARRMLAAALEEERKEEGRKGEVIAAKTRPGCGAWWLF